MNKLLLSLVLLTAFPVVSDELPIEYFANLPAVSDPRVSPDGRHIAVLVRNESGYYDVMVTPFGKQEFVVLASLHEAYDRIEWIGWANDDRLLVSASAPENIGSHHFRVSRLYSISVDGKENLQLIRPVQRQSQREYRSEGRVLSYLRDDHDHILLELYDERDQGVAVFKVNIYTNNFEKVQNNDQDVVRWIADSAGEVVLGLATEDRDEIDRNDLRRRFVYREPGSDEWKELKSFEVGKSATFDPVGLDETGKYVYVMSDHEVGRQSLYRYNISEAKFEDLIYTAPGFDLDGAIVELDGRVVGVTWYEHYLQQHYFDARDGALYDLVKKTFQGAEVTIASMDDARKKLVVYAVRDNTPGKYFLLDLNQGKASFWFSQYPELEKAALAAKTPYEFTARDGMKLNGYLTLPIADSDAKPPLVVLPHGGPRARDYRYFDYFAQFLANRGYAVLQMNFRGSSGFGSRYEVLGYREWGKAMQNDVIDAVDWVEKQDIVDTSNACIVGASYGGYVALTASYKTPERFNCFVSIAGISDLYDMVETDARFENAENVYGQLIGNYKDADDVADMQANSVIRFVDIVNKPVLLIHGTKDTQVTYLQSKNLYELARAKDKDVKYVEIKNATHYMDFGPNRLRVLSELEEFLEDHLH